MHYREKYAHLLDFLEAQILSLDGAEHKVLHRHLTSFLSPPKIDALKAELQVEVDRLLLDVLAKEQTHGSWDVVSDLAEQVTVGAIMRLMGLPGGPGDAHRLKVHTPTLSPSLLLTPSVRNMEARRSLTSTSL